MQIRKRLTTITPESAFDKALEKELTSAWQELAEVLNGGLRFGDNNNVAIVTVSDTDSADTEFTVMHNLNRVPSGFIIINRDQACIVYDSGTAWTSSAIYLACDTANCALSVLVF